MTVDGSAGTNACGAPHKDPDSALMAKATDGEHSPSPGGGSTDAKARGPAGDGGPAASSSDPCADRVRVALEGRDRLLSIAAHDIRTPLASLRLYLDALIKAAERGRLEPTDAATRLRKAQRQCDRLNILINNMVDAARGQSQPISLVLETFDLVPVVMTACDRVRDQFAHQGRALQVDAPSGAVLGDWDRPRLEQVVTNLLSNVYKHAPGASARVEIVPRGEERVLLRVSDDGPGIPDAHKASLFRPASADHPTLGMGLWIVARIVEAFGGTIRLEEEGKEERPDVASSPNSTSPPAGHSGGACFSIDLPLRRPPVPAGGPAHV